MSTITQSKFSPRGLAQKANEIQQENQSKTEQDNGY